MELAATLEKIRTGPQGPEVGAFFDFDGTVTHGFGRARIGRLMPRRTAGSSALMSSLLAGLSGRKSTAHPEFIRRLASRIGRDYAETDFGRIEERLFTRFVAGRLYPEAWHLIRAHQACGHTVVIATAALPLQIRATARELGIEHLLCSETVVAGHTDSEILWGPIKASAVKAFAASKTIDLAHSYAYSNGNADLPMLLMVGNPIAVNPDRDLAATAARRSWRVLAFRRRGIPGFYRMARTILALLAVLAVAAVAMVRSLGQDRQAAIDRMYVGVSTAGLHCAGIRVRITGSEHARTSRPAVFVFNHQSQIDTLIIPYVLRSAFIGVVTMKAQRYPIFGPLLKFVGVTFLDRSSPAQAVRALAGLVADLDSGRSVAIAPEGRISPTPQLLPFKKGAFHLAAQARVPIIPIVIRNSGEALWRSAAFVRPGTIDVAVLEPIDVSSWEPREYNQNVERLRRLYLDTLTRWPKHT
ncbi:HAD-IB family hydrolase [Nocardia gipuzkoensis]